MTTARRVRVTGANGEVLGIIPIDEARKLAQRMVRETQHGYSGYFNMPNHPNQNTRKGFTH